MRLLFLVLNLIVGTHLTEERRREKIVKRNSLRLSSIFDCFYVCFTISSHLWPSSILTIYESVDPFRGYGTARVLFSSHGTSLLEFLCARSWDRWSPHCDHGTTRVPLGLYNGTAPVS